MNKENEWKWNNLGKFVFVDNFFKMSFYSRIHVKKVILIH